MTKIGRNSPCQCGSGKKYKHCCGAIEKPPQKASSNIVETEIMFQQGIAQLLGQGVPVNPVQGISRIQQAAAADHPQSAYIAATIASSSFWQNRNWDTALDYLELAARLGNETALTSLQLLAGGPSAGPVTETDSKTLRKQVNIVAWVTPPELQVVVEDPYICTIKSFVTDNVCNWLIEQARDHLGRATIYDNATGGHTSDERRTNSQCDLDIRLCGVLTFVLRARIGAITNRLDQAMEIPKVLHYAPGETFAMHYDYLNPDVPAYAEELATRGQRTDTFLIYLNEDFSGGETEFPEISYSFKGNKGDAILFRNVDSSGKPDARTLHIGKPPIEGEKWIFSQWIREFPRL